MGTNYYWRINECECCKRFDEKHIGKSSGGWEFNFQGYRNAQETGDPKDDILSWEDWKARLRESGSIYDEYGTKLSFEEFVDLVENAKAPGKMWGSGETARPLLNHIDEIFRCGRYDEYTLKEYRDPNKHWKDPLGYAFSTTEFS